MGRYHGEYSLDTFSHSKAVLDKPLGVTAGTARAAG